MCDTSVYFHQLLRLPSTSLPGPEPNPIQHGDGIFVFTLLGSSRLQLWLVSLSESLLLVSSPLSCTPIRQKKEAEELSDPKLADRVGLESGVVEAYDAAWRATAGDDKDDVHPIRYSSSVDELLAAVACDVV